MTGAVVLRFARELPRISRTVRHLTARQVLARLWLSGRFRLYKYVPRAAGLGLSGEARLEHEAPAMLEHWMALKFADGLSERQRGVARDVADGRFTFLGRTLATANGRPDWRPPEMSRLWQYELPYAS